MTVSDPELPTTANDEAVLFADISGSTQLYERLGDAPTVTLVTALLDSLTKAGESAGGRLVKTIGDEVMMLFPSAVSAARAAIAMQRTCVDLANKEGLSLRIGFCAGRMQHRGNDVFGDTVNLAARLTGLATAGTIVTTSTSSDMAGTEFGIRSLGPHRFSGKAHPLQCVELIWSSEGLTAGEALQHTSSVPALRLTMGERCLMIRPGQTVKVGRQASCDVVIDDARVSKVHLSIGFGTGNYMLSDLSSNGTTLQADGHPPLLLRREKTLLAGSGQILLGPPEADDAKRTLRYDVQHELTHPSQTTLTNK